MTWLSQYVMPALIASLAVLCISRMLYPYRERLRVRARNLRAAQEALRDHLEAVATVLQDPGAPATVKQMVLLWSEIVADEEEALAAMAVIESPSARQVSPEMSENVRTMRADLKRMRIEREDLADAWDLALGAGLAVLDLRWCKPHEEANRLLIRGTSESRRLSLVISAIIELMVGSSRAPERKELVPLRAGC